MAPSNFVLTNPEVLRATIESRGENLRQRAEEPARRSGARQGPAGDQHDRHGGLPDRREHRGDPGQGRLPERSDAADPVRADDREGEAPAAADHPALDQQVLHPRPAARELVHPLGGRPGPHGVRRSPGSIPTSVSPQKSFEDYMREGPLAALDAMEEATGEREANVIGYCLGGTLLAAHARLYGGEARQPGQERHLFRDDGRFRRGRRALGLHRRGAARGARRAHERKGLSRSPRHGARPSTCCAPTI